MNRKEVLRGRANEMLTIAKDGFYYTHDDKYMDIRDAIDKMKENTYLYNDHKFIDKDMALELIKKPIERANFTVRVENKTTTESIRYWNEYVMHRVVALNFASAKNPGGGWLSGVNTQEESLTRTSLLYESLVSKMEFYNNNRKNLNKGLYNDSCIYSKAVPYIRDTTEEESLIDPMYADIITCAAVNRRGTLRHNIPESVVTLNMLNRIDSVVTTFIDQALKQKLSCPVLVVGAFGCGVFKNDPKVVAKLFKTILTKYSEVLSGMGAIVEFAIPGGVNYDTFKAILTK